MCRCYHFLLAGDHMTPVIQAPMKASCSNASADLSNYWLTHDVSTLFLKCCFFSNLVQKYRQIQKSKPCALYTTVIKSHSTQHSHKQSMNWCNLLIQPLVIIMTKVEPLPAVFAYANVPLVHTQCLNRPKRKPNTSVTLR